MYTQFFNLKQSPFSIAPDPRYLFMSERHREALAHLLYGIGSGGGFVLLTGEIGAGKTTVCRCFMEQIPENCKLGYIFNPKLSVAELLLSICDEFGIALPGGAVSVKGYVDAINAYLLASHAQARNNVLIIDEAQNLSAEVLEQLRLLTNLETSERKLLQIILIGQPELRDMLARPELEQLAQRVIARYHLGSLSEAETGTYIEHRLAVAGATAIAPFPRKLMGLVHKLTKGVPRRINLLCDRAMLGAYVENQPQVTSKILRRAAAEVFAGQGASSLNGGGVNAGFGLGAGARVGAGGRWPLVAAGVVAGVALSALAWQFTSHDAGPSSARAASAMTPASGGNGATSGSSGAAGVSGPAATSGNGAAGRGNGMAASSAVAGAAVGGGAGAGGAVGVAGTAGAGSMPGTAAARNPVAESAAALRQLAGMWGLSLTDGDPCQTAARANLRCLQTKGGIDDLRLLDRPAMLKLHDDPTAPTYVLLTALDDKNATIATVGGKPQTISIDTLESRYDNEFTTYWRAPRSWRDEVSHGDHGPDVDWLAKRLSQIYDLKKPQENQPLDATLRQRLIEFQTAQNLKADGVAGPKTFIRLYQLGGVQEPRLR